MRPWGGLLAFAALAFSLSWTAWALHWALSGVAPLAGDALGRLATYGPGMAAVLSSRSWWTPNAQSPTRTTLLWPLATLALAVLVTWRDVRQLSEHPTRLAAALLALSWAAPVGVVWLARPGSGGLSPRRHLTTWRVPIGWWLLTVTMTGGAFLLGHHCSPWSGGRCRTSVTPRRWP